MLSFQVELSNEELQKEINRLSSLCKTFPKISEIKERKKEKELSVDYYKKIILKSINLTEQDLILHRTLKVSGIKSDLFN